MPAFVHCWEESGLVFSFVSSHQSATDSSMVSPTLIWVFPDLDQPNSQPVLSQPVLQPCGSPDGPHLSLFRRAHVWLGWGACSSWTRKESFMVSKSTDCVTSLLSSSCHSFLLVCPFCGHAPLQCSVRTPRQWIKWHTYGAKSGLLADRPSRATLPPFQTLCLSAQQLPLASWAEETRPNACSLLKARFFPSFCSLAPGLLPAAQSSRPPAPSPGFPLTACMPASSLGPNVLMWCWGGASPASPAGSSTYLCVMATARPPSSPLSPIRDYNT